MKAIFTCLSIFFTSLVFANNIQLQKVSLADTNRTAKTVNIKMNISWEHSWRDSINWDAAWIIIKFKESKDSNWKWKHGQLLQSGNSVGSGAGVKIVVPDDRTGAFFYRSVIGSGNISSDNVKLLWNYGASGVSNIDSVEVRVFATEMVYVPQGNYCLGDGNGTKRSTNSFQLKNAQNNYAVINDKWSPIINTGGNSGVMPGPLDDPIPDDDIAYISGFRVSGMNGLDINDDKVADYPNFPTGYKGFYCMKYKVTQGEYTDFLNTLFANDTAAQVIDTYVNGNTNVSKLKSVPKQMKAVLNSLADYLYSTPADYKRNTIFLDSVQLKFVVSRPDRAYDLMNLNRGLSFSEWLGLRPMSELEFEKAARGPLPPTYGEKVWGSEAGNPAATSYGVLTYSGIENGAEYFVDYDITKRYLEPVGSSTTVTVKGGDGGVGPYRVGIYATDTSSRISSGASYYGIMDLNKITGEIVVPVSNPACRSFSAYSNGKGLLSAFGNNYTFSVLNGFLPDYTNRFYDISSRFNYGRSIGFRAVRLAPSDN